MTRSMVCVGTLREEMLRIMDLESGPVSNSVNLGAEPAVSVSYIKSEFGHIIITEDDTHNQSRESMCS